MAVAFNGNQLGIYRFEGDKELTRVLLAPAQITALWWLGEPHHDAILVATRNSEDTARALIAQDDMLVPRFVRDWGLSPPAPSKSALHSMEITLTPTSDRKALHAERCWYKEPTSSKGGGTSCVIVTHATVWPTLEIAGTDETYEEVEHPVPARLPTVRGKPGLHYEIGQNGVACTDGTTDPRPVVYDMEAPPVVEWISVEPPIARVTDRYQVMFLEGCAVTKRFTAAAVAPNGTVVLYGRDLAIVRGGKVVRMQRNVFAQAVAFPP